MVGVIFEMMWMQVFGIHVPNYEWVSARLSCVTLKKRESTIKKEHAKSERRPKKFLVSCQLGGAISER